MGSAIPQTVAIDPFLPGNLSGRMGRDAPGISPVGTNGPWFPDEPNMEEQGAGNDSSVVRVRVPAHPRVHADIVRQSTEASSVSRRIIAAAAHHSRGANSDFLQWSVPSPRAQDHPLICHVQ